MTSDFRLIGRLYFVLYFTRNEMSVDGNDSDEEINRDGVDDDDGGDCKEDDKNVDGNFREK